MATSADYAAVVAACRDALTHGTRLGGDDLRLVIDVVQHAANTLDNTAAATALDAVITTQLGLWSAAGTGNSSAVYTAAVAALVTPRAAALAVTGVTDIPTHLLDGRAG